MKKAELLARREALETLWKDGISGLALLEKNTELIDTHLRQCFNRCPEASKGMAIVALGGYGRRELFPFSDVDLLLLHEAAPDEDIEKVAEAVFYPLWDAGIEVGHGVRTIEACMEDALEDFFFQVAMLDARIIAGSSPLFDKLMSAFNAKYIEGLRHHFLDNMLAHRSKRHEQFGRHSYLLEPHIKESRGGLRDVQAMLWTSHFVYGLHGLNDLEEAGLLSWDKKHEFREAWDHLIKIRNRLHYISGRKNDQLYFEHQEDMSKAFGYKKSNGLLAVEHFMRQVYSHLQTIAVITDLFFEHVDETLNLSKEENEVRVLEPGIESKNGQIHLVDSNLLAKRPAILMRLFQISARAGLPLHHRTRNIINQNLHLIDDRQRNSRRVAKSFLEAIQSANEPLNILAPMLETGLLATYIPEFSRVESLAQHDVYHMYTVDSHLLQAVSELHQLNRKEQQLFSSIKSKNVLYLSVLLHDIGKGEGSKHAERGAKFAEIIGKRLGLGDEEISDLVYLINNHLFLSNTALHRDLEDEAFLKRCAEKIKNTDRLTMLYLLSIADARATGPAAWNDWKAALLLEFYLKVTLLLEKSGPTESDHQENARWMRKKLAEMLGKDLAWITEKLPTDYLLTFTPEGSADHVKLSRDLKKGDILVYPTAHQGSWSLLLLTKDRSGLLARIFGVLALHNLNVLSAQIFTWEDGTVVDVMDIDSIVGEQFEAQEWDDLKNDLHLAITNQLGLAHRLSWKLKPASGSMRQIKPRSKPRVTIDNETSDNYTIVDIEVYAEDRAALHYDIANTFADFGINIFRAKIARQAEKLVDVFYVLGSDHNKIDKPELQEEIRQALLYAVS